MPETEEFPYRRIIDDLRDQILSGHRAPGERMPSEHELAEEYRTSRPTVRRALAVLKAEGLIVTEQGRGAFVRPSPHVRLLVSGANYRRHRAAGLPGFNAQAFEQGQKPRQVIREVATVSAQPTWRCDWTSTRSPVIVRRRTFWLEDLPVGWRQLLPGPRQPEPRLSAQQVRGGVYALIEDPDGPIRKRVARSVDDITARCQTRRGGD
jgi:GntR family transcriptional regulator